MARYIVIDGESEREKDGVRRAYETLTEKNSALRRGQLMDLLNRGRFSGCGNKLMLQLRIFREFSESIRRLYL